MRGRFIALACIMFIVCFCGITGHTLLELRHQAWNSAMREAENLLQALSQDIARNIELYDLSLLAVVDGLKLEELPSLSPAMRHAVLFDRAATARYLGSILVLDETGKVIEDSGANPPRSDRFDDREYFLKHRDTPGLGLLISAPYRRRLTGNNDLVIAFSRRIDHPDGSFAGVVSSTLRLDYFKDLFERFSLGERAAVSLARSDGTILMRTPFKESLIGQQLARNPIMRTMMASDHGRFLGKAMLDDVVRVVNFVHIRGLPLILGVSLSEHEVYAAWNSRAQVIALVMVAVCTTLACLGLMFSWELDRRFRAEAETRRSEAELRLLTDHSTDVIIRLDANLVRRYVSPSCVNVFGYTPEEMIGQQLRATMHPEDWPHVSATLAHARQHGDHAEVAYRIRHRDGQFVWVEGQYGFMSGDGGFTVVLRDISQRKVAEQDLSNAHAELTRLATTDGLTGIANRRRFDEAILREWRRAAREEVPLSLLLLDVDQFKPYNDRYGHQAGDGCLKAIAKAVDICVRRPADLVARYGGEEFAVLLPGTNATDAAILAERVRSAVADLQLPHEGNPAHDRMVTASIGVVTIIPPKSSTLPESDANIRELVVAADQALYLAKRQGRNRVAISGAPLMPVELSLGNTTVRTMEPGLAVRVG